MTYFLWDLTKQDPAVSLRLLRSLNFGGTANTAVPPVKTLEGTVPPCPPMIYATDRRQRKHGRSPKCVRTRRSVFSSDRRCSPDVEEWVPMQQSRRYSGAAPWSDRKTSRQSLYSMRNGTGSQWRTSRRSGVMWSYFLLLQMSLAAALRTDLCFYGVLFINPASI